MLMTSILRYITCSRKPTFLFPDAPKKNKHWPDPKKARRPRQARRLDIETRAAQFESPPMGRDVALPDNRHRSAVHTAQ